MKILPTEWKENFPVDVDGKKGGKMTNPTQTELYQKLTDALDRKVPEYWASVTIRGKTYRPLPAGAFAGDVLLNGWRVEPTLSQLLQLIEVNGYIYELGVTIEGKYWCSIARINNLSDYARIYRGANIMYAVTLAVIEVLERKKKP